MDRAGGKGVWLSFPRDNRTAREEENQNYLVISTSPFTRAALLNTDATKKLASILAILAMWCILYENSMRKK
jgi:hypothetical protein